MTVPGDRACGCRRKECGSGGSVAGSAVAALACRYRAVARPGVGDRDVSCVDGRGRSDGYGRIAIRNSEDGARTLTPHQVGARLGYGPIPAGATVLHDCEVRLCCRAAPGHLRVGTQSENMRQAVARGRAVGPHPGRVDVRGKAGASRAIQAALRAAADRSPAALASVLAAVIDRVTRGGTCWHCSTRRSSDRRWPRRVGRGAPGCGSARGRAGAGARWTAASSRRSGETDPAVCRDAQEPTAIRGPGG